MRIITLTTDFGTSDWFVGTMKGVIAGIAPEARVIDLTHDIAPGDIRAGAFALRSAISFFPQGSIHVAVVDPGVGSARRAIAARNQAGILVGPDNGVLSWAAPDEEIDEVRELTNPEWFEHPVSRTFHGRDIFAPVAAHLAAGKHFEEAGQPVDSCHQLPWPAIREEEHGLTGEIVHVDRFGNAITNITVSELPEEALASGDVRVTCAGKTTRTHRCYADVARGKALALVGSGGLLELAVNAGDFADHFGVSDGSRVEVRWE